MSYLLARGAQAMSYYPSTPLRTGSEQLTYLLFLKIADEQVDSWVRQREHMKLPYAARALVERKKVVEYLLLFSHPDGSSKARPEKWGQAGFSIKASLDIFCS